MPNIDVRKVTCHKEQNDFISVPKYIYKDCPQWVPDLDRDIRLLFDRRRNPGAEFCHIQSFVAYRHDVPIGRIVGIVNCMVNERWQQRVVRFGLIEFIDDLDVSQALIETVERWGRTFGMDTLQGPMGITDFDKEGMLVEDFHMTGTMNTIYNHDYYPAHLRSLGFQKAVDWVQIRVEIPKEVPARYARTAQYVRENMKLRVVKLDSPGINKRHYAEHAMRLFNEAYQPIFGFAALSEAQIATFLDRYLPIINPQMVPIVINEQQEVVGAAVTIGSLTEALQKAAGRLWPTGWWHLLKAMKWRHEDTVEMLLIAVRPDCQGMGVNAMFFDHLVPIYNQYKFKWAETGPQLETNNRELSQWKDFNPQFTKRRRCYGKRI